MEFIQTLPLLTIHVTAVFATLAVVVIADIHGLLWILGKMSTLPHQRMRLLHGATWIGLLTIITAGASMFITYPEYLLSLTAFKLKMLFVAGLLINAFFIGAHMKLATTTPFASLAGREKRILLVSGFISTAGWIGAYICAQFLS